jgi:hypothetical protein
MRLLTLVMFFLALSVAPAFAQHSASLSWAWSQGTGDPATGFHVWRTAGTTCATGQTTPYATVASPSTFSYTDNAVTGGASYCYTVSAYNATGDSAMSNTYTATIPLNVPSPPTSLTGVAK